MIDRAVISQWRKVFVRKRCNYFVMTTRFEKVRCNFSVFFLSLSPALCRKGEKDNMSSSSFQDLFPTIFMPRCFSPSFFSFEIFPLCLFFPSRKHSHKYAGVCGWVGGAGWFGGRGSVTVDCLYVPLRLRNALCGFAAAPRKAPSGPAPPHRPPSQATLPTGIRWYRAGVVLRPRAPHPPGEGVQLGSDADTLIHE